MPVVISLLRGINVGGHHKIPMHALRAVYESLGLRDVRTYVQSGNVVFRTAERGLGTAAARIEDALAAAFGFRPAVITRTYAELRDVIARNPFAGRAGIQPSRLLVLFLASAPAVREIISGGPEEVHVDGREVYMYFPHGMARPKISPALVEKILKTPGTGRNWNTVCKLVAMAEELEHST